MGFLRLHGVPMLLLCMLRTISVERPVPTAHGTLEKGQLYTDDLASAAALASWVQAVIDVVCGHSQWWGWTLNAAKRSVVAFGPAAARAHSAEVELFWGTTNLSRSPAEKELGLHMHEYCSWNKNV